MNRSDWEQIAKVVAKVYESGERPSKSFLVTALSAQFCRRHQNFDPEKFAVACGLETLKHKPQGVTVEPGDRATINSIVEENFTVRASEPSHWLSDWEDADPQPDGYEPQEAY